MVVGLLYRYVAVATIFCSFNTAYAQSSPDMVDQASRNFDSCNITISGEINQATAVHVRQDFALLHNGNPKLCSHVTVQFDSLGGDVDAAIEVGVFLRAKQAWVSVPIYATCASSCVLAFLGGVERSIVGRVGIHRPFGVGLSSSINDSSSTYSRVNKTIGNYLDEMNISSDLLNAMNAVPPDDVRWLTYDQSGDLQVSGTDPVWQDLSDSDVAKSLGITKSTLYERRGLAKMVCDQTAGSTEQMMCTWRVVREGAVK